MVASCKQATKTATKKIGDSDALHKQRFSYNSLLGQDLELGPTHTERGAGTRGKFDTSQPRGTRAREPAGWEQDGREERRRCDPKKRQRGVYDDTPAGDGPATKVNRGAKIGDERIIRTWRKWNLVNCVRLVKSKLPMWEKTRASDTRPTRSPTRPATAEMTM